jgi:hypothetical protein
MTRDCHPDKHDEHVCVAHGHSFWPTGAECCCEAQREMDAVADQIRSNNERAFAEIFGRIAEQARKQ